MVRFGVMLRQARRRKLLSQAEVAQRVGVSPSAVSSWEAERQLPYPRNQRTLAEALGIAPEELAQWIEEAEQAQEQAQKGTQE